ncbi:MAG: ribosome silencing factor [Ramlibacter sp.]|nr:ribosome silencing factor [Ramlibacter sp.]
MTQDAASARKDTQKLQRAIVDGLEDVKAHDIQVFNTEHLSPLFERVIVASGTSNRQTKALASSVRDAVREAGFPKPRIEGEENGEWIIVDCGAAVAHIMQPAIRQYYHLEEIWGDKPVRLKFGAPKPAEASAPEPKAPAKKAGKKVAEGEMTSLRRSSAAKTAVKAAEREAKEEKARATPARKGASRPTVGRTRAQPAGKSAARPAARTGSKTPVKVVGKPPAKKAPTKKAPAKKTASKAPSRRK